MSELKRSEYVDVLIVGAGLSGIGAAYHLQTRCPGKTYVIVEARPRIGGTWDQFRYPGVRSDSDMSTLGYSFRPWSDPRAIAPGSTILQYVRDTAREFGIEPKIRFQQRVVRAAWSTADAAWHVELVGPDDKPRRMRCNFLYMCSGYFDYEHAHEPDFPGADRFTGPIIHPQRWPETLDCAGKRIVVIGSGATAITLVPELAKTAAHVTMLQRSPTYVVARPARDPIANKLRRLLPPKAAHAITRWKNVLLGMYFYRMCKRKPHLVKRWILRGVRAALGPDYDIATHFTPRYKPWDQRMCLVPDGDLFAAIRRGRAAVVTDQVERFEASGIRLRSGAKLDADIIVTATGFNMLPLGGIELSVDGEPVDLPRKLTYKGMTLSDVPNLAFAGGYTNASWTLKCDLTAEYVCRLLRHMARTGMRQCTPRNTDPSVVPDPVSQLSSGYLLRALDRLPKQGSKTPWRLHQNYIRDLLILRFGRVDDGVMRFSNPLPTHFEDTTGPAASSLPPRHADESAPHVPVGAAE